MSPTAPFVEETDDVSPAVETTTPGVSRIKLFCFVHDKEA
jgi:hypothetical protein